MAGEKKMSKMKTDIVQDQLQEAGGEVSKRVGRTPRYI